MARSTVHYADNETNNILKRLHNKLRPAGTPVQRVEYIIELLLLRIFEVKLKHEETFQPLRKLFGKDNYTLLFTHLLSLTGEQIKAHLNQNIFPFYASILSKSRKIFSENLPQKVQDQLVLIEEVFANSSFSTNVQSGNMSEIINLVAEIDEHRILKTDLLGDAIESALSETGGTRDIGLFRTPDHIRQMMVALANPDFSDTIFDPACGSGGFLFDSYQYVLENATKDGKWPGERTHPEIKEYFKNYFSKTPSNIPSKDIATHFYRAGIGGIEYLGMIRKMAAINLYVRNLNPQNIQQGDSLKMFDPLTDANTKSIVIANPPFGAERDQPAYPNVWEEYSRESETTILFVKLMFELLKSKGRCAVVVSEGFLTWSQNSARALRRKLLEEANLKAIISLPQGVFVSKNGQGAKTSILYFEKGEPTQWIWCYKIDNDGYSLGVNRKVISGCQIPEVIELFTQHVKKRIIPPETKQRFVIPAEWVKTLDPRVKEKITHETKEELLAEQNDARKKLEEKLTAQLNKKTLDKKEYAQKLWQFENVWENKIQNETAKRIEREYAYSFNLQNYRSNLSNEQRDSWKKEFVKIKPLNNSSLDERYEHLQDADIKTALSILASFEPNNALHIDIAREYLNTVKEKDKTFQRLDEILKKGHKYPFVSLNDYLLYQSEKIKPIKYPDTEFVVLGVSNQNGVFVNEKKKGEEIKQTYFIVEKNQFCYNPYRVNVGSIGLNEFDFENQIISGAYVVFSVKESEILPKYLLALVNTKRFLKYVNEEASGGVRLDFKFEYLQDWHIPLPPSEIQQEIVEKIEKQRAIIEGAKKILDGWEVTPDLFDNNWKNFNYPAHLIVTGGTPSRNKAEYYNGSINWFKSGELNNKTIYESEEMITTEAVKNSNAKIFPENTVLIALIGATIGDVALLGRKGCVNQNVGGFLPWDKVLSNYLFWYLRGYSEKIKMNQKQGAQPSLNLSDLKKLQIPIPSLDIQHQIAAELDKEMEALKNVRLLKENAEKRIEQMLNEIWGE